MEKPIEVEYLSAEETPEDQVVAIEPLKFTGVLEQFKNLFDRMGGIREKVILWEKKTVIKDAKSRDEAIRLRTMVTKTSKLIDDTRMAYQKEVLDGIKEMNQYAKDAQTPLTGTKDNPALGVAGRLTEKISKYAAECKRLEEELKAKALAEQRALEEKKAAEERERQAQEQKKREEEAARIEAVRLKALEEAKALEQAQGELAEGEVPSTDAEDHVLNAIYEEQARIDAERAEKEKAAEEKRIQDQKELDAQQQKTVTTMAVATAKGSVKGVKEIWSIELVDEEKLEKRFMTFDPAKARKWLDGGFYNKKETDAEKIIPGLRCVVVLGKGGR
jgi:hypothetical protein